MQATDHYSIPLPVKQSERETLVATRILERVVAHQADVLHASGHRPIQGHYGGAQFLDLGSGRLQAVALPGYQFAQRRMVRARACPDRERPELPLDSLQAPHLSG